MPRHVVKLRKSAKNLTSSSRDWLTRQINDPYVEKARQDGYRSRAAYKLIEIEEKFKILKKGKVIVDLGAAPGGWSQIAVTKVGEGNVVALDLLQMDKIYGVEFIQMDFLADGAAEQIKSILAKVPANKSRVAECDIVLSDMAANSTGDRFVDHLRIVNLLEEALHLSEQILKPGGAFVGKIFQGGSSDQILANLRKNFSKVRYFKPDSSRQSSSETYLVAIGFKQVGMA